MKNALYKIVCIAATFGRCRHRQLPKPAKGRRDRRGVLYVDTDTAQSLSKNGQLYLAVFAEEQFTDAEFLQSLREDESLREAAGAMYLYLFDSKGTEYTVAAHYIIDKAGNVCLDMGGESVVQSTAGKQEMLAVYAKAVDALQSKSQKNRWLKK